MSEDNYRQERSNNDRPRFGGDRNSGGRFGGNRGGGRNFSSGPREMHKAKCADCGKECEVPFKPAEDRPVYCRDCYAAHKPKRDY